VIGIAATGVVLRPGEYIGVLPFGAPTLRIRLVSERTGQPIGAGMAFLRDICHIVDALICYIGFLFPLWDAKRQTLADKIVKTVVVNA
jgi:uncharacterized RDD family membrane protein YckC